MTDSQALYHLKLDSSTVFYFTEHDIVTKNSASNNYLPTNSLSCAQINSKMHFTMTATLKYWAKEILNTCFNVILQEFTHEIVAFLVCLVIVKDLSLDMDIHRSSFQRHTSSLHKHNLIRLKYT